MRVEVTARLSAVDAGAPNVLSRGPWVYCICCPRHRLLYIGETYDEGGLVGRLGVQLGPGQWSTFRQRSREIAGVAEVGGAVVILAVSLHSESAEMPFDGASKQVRLAVESHFHDLAVRRAALVVADRWRLVSSSTPPRISLGPKGIALCDLMFEAFQGAMMAAIGLSRGTPMQVFLLSPVGSTLPRDVDWQSLLEEFEMVLCDWVVETLTASKGELWWQEAVPTGVRTKCATRHAEEAAPLSVPPWAYLDLVDLRSIIDRNWSDFGTLLEKLSGEQGKDRATKWLVEFNETRKLAAHPLKRRYVGVDGAVVARLAGLRKVFRGIAGR